MKAFTSQHPLTRKGNSQRKLAVQREATHFATILGRINDAFFALDCEWRVTYINDQASQMVKQTPKELLGKIIWDIFPYTADSVFYQQNLLALEKQTPVHFEEYYPPLNAWFRVHVYPSEEGITAYFHDITTQKIADEQLLFQATILQYVDDCVLVTNLQGKIIYWNEGARDIFGYTAKEMMGKTTASLYPEMNLAQLAPDLQQMREGKAYIGEWKGRRKDGAFVWLDVKIALMRNAEGKVIGYIGIAKDITEQKQAEEELHQSKEQLEAILNNITNGIIVQDVNGKLIYANPAAAMLFNYRFVEEMLNAAPLSYLERFDMTDERGKPFTFSRLPGRRALAGEHNPHMQIRVENKKTHEVLWVAIKSTAICDKEQRPYLVLSVIQDVTQFKELDQQKDEFIVNVSHELRTPLTGLCGYLELLKDHNEQLDVPTKTKFFSQAIENCNELTRLVDSVLDALKTAETMKELQREKLPIAQAVQEVLEEIPPDIKQDYALHVEISEQEHAWANKHSVQQVLRNLLSNAFKYAPRHTPIIISATISTESNQGADAVPQVCICVQDAGPGIPLAEQRLLFQKFVRLRRDLSSAVRGTGLGLYICKHLVETMSGRIWVESTGKAEEGSRFCFTLPL